MSALVIQFPNLLQRRHVPRRSPIHPGSIILTVQLCLVVHYAPTAIGAILRQIAVPVTPLVVNIIIDLLGFSLAPREVIAVFFGAIGSDIASRPECTAGQA